MGTHAIKLPPYPMFVLKDGQYVDTVLYIEANQDPNDWSIIWVGRNNMWEIGDFDGIHSIDMIKENRDLSALFNDYLNEEGDYAMKKCWERNRKLVEAERLQIKPKPKVKVRRKHETFN